MFDVTEDGPKPSALVVVRNPLETVSAERSDVLFVESRNFFVAAGANRTVLPTSPLTAPPSVMFPEAVSV
jgi:hypothetical protein